MSTRVVLVVDDEPFIRMGLQDALEAEGFKVIEADGAAEALDWLASLADIEILISDVKMPGMDGFELASRAAACRPGLRIIMISGHADAVDARIPADVQFIRKPFPLLPFAAWLRGNAERLEHSFD